MKTISDKQGIVKYRYCTNTDTVQSLRTDNGETTVRP